MSTGKYLTTSGKAIKPICQCILSSFKYDLLTALPIIYPGLGISPGKQFLAQRKEELCDATNRRPSLHTEH